MFVEKDRNIHLNDTFSLNIADFLPKAKFPGKVFPKFQILSMHENGSI